MLSHDANVMPWQRFPEEQTRCSFIPEPRRHRATLRRERLAFDAINQWATIQRRDRHCQRCFAKP